MNLAKRIPLTDAQKLEIDNEAHKRVNFFLKHPEVQVLIKDHTDDQIIEAIGCTKEYLLTWREWAEPIYSFSGEKPEIVGWLIPDFKKIVTDLRLDKRTLIFNQSK
ncbi:hypothetical protein K1F50_01545 [Muricauda oceani]|uniref:Uncharacterized protein n=1 Tax=Flagellimonas oceani TaxID=2698672 RepID=A0A6G7J1P3_9FLAO|nr:hypothetical protein [Allomuricauda oceani]MBW8241465.1 hypothetical protein [Allomuricauda oceani]QII44539.1 hypothetical protein GVT53_07565 [Allomuricauda oceani]